MNLIKQSEIGPSCAFAGLKWHNKTAKERSEVGITPGVIRISVGLEYADDIAADIIQALE